RGAQSCPAPSPRPAARTEAPQPSTAVPVPRPQEGTAAWTVLGVKDTQRSRSGSTASAPGTVQDRLSGSAAACASRGGQGGAAWNCALGVTAGLCDRRGVGHAVRGLRGDPYPRVVPVFRPSAVSAYSRIAG